MKIRSIVIVFIILVLSKIWAVDSDIRLNSLGFLPDMPKKAAIIAECSDFSVVDISNDQPVLRGTVTDPRYQEDIDQTIRVADFSSLIQPGTYYLDMESVGRSIDFQIGNRVFDFALYTTMRGFYLLRCGTAVKGEHKGQMFAHDSCHMEDGWLYHTDSDSVHRDGVGGWHDAGDYGKYVPNACLTVGTLFLAWEHFKDRLEYLSLDIPETAPDYPDFLKEIKWETDWFLKMSTVSDSGKVLHKLTRLNFSGFIMPEEDLEKRYFTDWSTEASADFTAVMAMAARHFAPYDSLYANKCLGAAIRSYTFLKHHPENRRANQEGFRTGRYASDDRDDRLWAAAELWEATGNNRYLADFEILAKAESLKIELVFDWAKLQNLGMFTYLLSEQSGKDALLEEAIRKRLMVTADSLIYFGENDVYNRTLADRYWWGCNGILARQSLILYAAYLISSEFKYIHAIVDIVDYLFGRNYYGRSYITGLGYLPPMYPHDRRSAADGIDPPWPGYLVGGGETATDWTDDQTDYRTNEIAINWQAALVYALAVLTSCGN
jgi:endoglucanase